jgi:hypothetical protein
MRHGSKEDLMRRLSDHRSSHHRRRAKLSDSTARQLDRYALACSAAAVGALALAQPAEGKIVYTPTHHIIKTDDVYWLELNHTRTIDFYLSNHSFCTADVCGRTLRVTPGVNGNQIAGSKGVADVFYALALPRGARIGPQQPFSGKLMAASGTEYGSVGKWFNVSDRYLGLKFLIQGKIHYGWARLNVSCGSGKISAVLTGYAYETVPKKPIIAGETKGAEIDGEQGTLGHLARGTGSAPIWRAQ